MARTSRNSRHHLTRSSRSCGKDNYLGLDHMTESPDLTEAGTNGPSDRTIKYRALSNTIRIAPFLNPTADKIRAPTEPSTSSRSACAKVFKPARRTVLGPSANTAPYPTDISPNGSSWKLTCSPYRSL